VNRRRPDTPTTTASGITIKMPNEKPKKQSSGMLNKHLEESDKPATQPLESRGNIDAEKQQQHNDPTMPISDDVLNQLAALDEDDENSDNEAL
jgi:hypothetical protein